MSSKVLEVIDNKSQAKKLPLPERDLLRLYEIMVLTRHMDERALKLQRSGRIAFYGSAQGQEAAQIGSAFALAKDDYIAPAYREPGAALTRGVTVRELLTQYFGNKNDICFGRQMPVHYCFSRVNYLSISSPIGTQIMHATGLGMAFRIKKSKQVCITYFGDGATSSNDFHAGLTFAGVYKANAIFFCNNNGWAISCPADQQCAAETLSDKAVGYGMPGVRVDGNDVLAVYQATKEAIDRCKRGEGPTFIEAVTYRMESHSTSDDARRYRDEKEVAEWAKKDPLKRYQKYLKDHGILTDKLDKEYLDKATQIVADAINAEQDVEAPDPLTIFNDVYADMPWHIREQRDFLKRELEEGGHH